MNRLRFADGREFMVTGRFVTTPKSFPGFATFALDVWHIRWYDRVLGVLLAVYAVARRLA